MPYTVEFLDEAIQEAEEAAQWYAERSQTAAFAFSDEVSLAISQIERAPNAWPTHEQDTRRFLLRRFPYSVVYRVAGNRVVIIAVAHTSRRPHYWNDRLGDV